MQMKSRARVLAAGEHAMVHGMCKAAPGGSDYNGASDASCKSCERHDSVALRGCSQLCLRQECGLCGGTFPAGVRVTLRRRNGRVCRVHGYGSNKVSAASVCRATRTGRATIRRRALVPPRILLVGGLDAVARSDDVSPLALCLPSWVFCDACMTFQAFILFLETAHLRWWAANPNFRWTDNK